MVRTESKKRKVLKEEKVLVKEREERINRARIRRDTIGQLMERERQ